MVVFFNKTALDERTITNYNNRSYTLKWDSSSSSNCKSDGSSNIYSGPLSSDGSYPSTFNMGANFESGGERCGVTVHSDATYIYYNNTITITYGENPNANIIREEYDVYNIFCYRNRTVEEKLNGGNFSVESRVDGAETKSKLVKVNY